MIWNIRDGRKASHQLIGRVRADSAPSALLKARKKFDIHTDIIFARPKSRDEYAEKGV